MIIFKLESGESGIDNVWKFWRGAMIQWQLKTAVVLLAKFTDIVCGVHHQKSSTLICWTVYIILLWVWRLRKVFRSVLLRLGARLGDLTREVRISFLAVFLTKGSWRHGRCICWSSRAVCQLDIHSKPLLNHVHIFSYPLFCTICYPWSWATSAPPIHTCKMRLL